MLGATVTAAESLHSVGGAHQEGRLVMEPAFLLISLGDIC